MLSGGGGTEAWWVRLQHRLKYKRGKSLKNLKMETPAKSDFNNPVVSLGLQFVKKKKFALLLKHFLIIFPSVCDVTGALLLRRLQARGEAKLGLAEETGRSRSTESS